MQNFTLPPLPYAYNALEPHVSEQIMHLHHDKHHQAYVNNLNAALAKQREAVQANDVKEQIRLQSLIKFNGGGHINHSLFWNNLAPTNSSETVIGAAMLQKITDQWGDFSNFEQELSKTLTSIQGSGWAWLTRQPNGELAILTTKDQDPVTSSIPLLGIDMWEHAYYSQYYNDKASYVSNIFKVINWQQVEARFNQSAARMLI